MGIKIVVAICTFQRFDLLNRLLNTLREKTFSTSSLTPETEVLVIDNEPSVKTRLLSKELSDKYPVPLSYIQEFSRGISQARNCALEYALASGAEYVVFMDDDDLPGPDWINHLWAEHQRSQADIVFGTWILSDDLPKWVHESGIFNTKKMSKQRSDSESHLHSMASTCNVLIRCSFVSAMKESGMLFDPELGLSGGEDKDFFIRAQANGATFSYAQESYVVRGHEISRHKRLGILKRGFKNGSSRMGRKRRHEDGKSSVAQLLSSFLKLMAVLLILPFSVFSRSFFIHELYRLGKACGVIYGFFARKDYAYYGQ